MKIVLIKPNTLTDHIQPPLGLGYLASAVRNHNEVNIIDCIKDNLNINRLLETMDFLRPDIAGFQCYTQDLPFIKKALAGCKRISKNMTTVIGGPHPSALPHQSFEYFSDSLDYAFVGEAECGFAALADKLAGVVPCDFSEIPGLIWEKDGKAHINKQVFVDNLDSLGMPSWDLLKPETYPESQHGAFFRKFPIAPIIATRGCPFFCTFCAGNIVSGKELRKHSIDFMLRQIQYLYDTHNIREFHIIDDNFTLNRDYAKDFLRKLINLDLDISWATPNGVRIDSLDEELLSLMKRSGLYLISLGIESGSDRILRLMKKNLTVETTKKMVRLIKNQGLEVAGFFILGFPGETKEDILNTINLSLELDLTRANYFTYLPFPGTESYHALAKSGKLNTIEQNKFYFMMAAFTPEGITQSELKMFQRLAFCKFYLRPRILWKNLTGVKSFKHLYFLMKRFFHWIIMN